ncbi:hypothetical protein B0J13DRAFT_69852 [Dactylonectria estremocensis]|uniref:Zn(2)-C6 fungal-type domain-containing protein n=1 Tax=Dactylonectria estremocensis TaxID=1079267 RepID=A0A9P9EKV4_9HYPO|nr:hypothetical protein B0J13DRAFT_69852 [Dactylonectria estremocensis]
MDSTEDTNGPRKQRRDKYISRACQACRRRKIKCSGHETCLNCIDRGSECVYISERRKRGQKQTKTRHDEPRYPDPSPDRASPSDGRLDVSQDAGSSHTWHEEIEMTGILPGPQIDVANRTSTTPTSDHELAWSARRRGAQTKCFTLQLPATADLKLLLKKYFSDIHHEYPFLDQQDIETRLSFTLGQLGRQPNRSSTVLEVDGEAFPLIALVCSILSIAQVTLDIDTAPTQNEKPSSPPGLPFHELSKNILHAFEPHQISLDIIRCHTLQSLYALHTEMLHPALQSHSIATRQLTTMHCSELCRETQPRCKKVDNLWLVIFVLDRKLSRIAGTSHTLHLDQIPVELREGLESSQISGPTCEKHEQITRGQGLSPRAQYDTHQTRLFLEALGSLGHIWGSLFDQIRSPIKGCSIRASALLDTELLVFRATLAHTLRWETDRDSEGGTASESVANLSRRLIVLTDANIMRLQIRQNLPNSCGCFRRMRPDGLEIVRETLQAVQQFTKRVSHDTLPSSLTITSSLVQCVLFLLTVLDESSEVQESDKASDMVEEMYGMLMDMATTSWTAQSAIATLDAALFSPVAEASVRQAHQACTPRLHVSIDQTIVQRSSPAENRAVPSVGDKSLGDRSKGSSLLDELQAGYQELDLISPVHMQERLDGAYKV